VDLNASQGKVILVGQGTAPFGIRVKAEYSISAVYICDAFLAIYSGTSFALPDFDVRLATTGDEIYFRHVSAVNYRDSSLEICLSQGKKSKHIAVGSETNATVLLETLRTKLRAPQASAREAATVPGRSFQYVALVSPANSDPNAEMEPRYCYLRASKLMEYYSDPAVRAALLEQLQVPGTVPTIKGMTDREQQEAIEAQIDHFRRTPNSFWYGMQKEEVLAASIWRAGGHLLRIRLVRDKFYAVSREEDLMRPVARWLTERGEEPYMEIPLGRRRIDVLGYRRSGVVNSDRLTAVELKNDDEQFRRGPDQMGTFAEYAHAVYLACTPAFAAEYLERNANNRNVNRWDPGLLDRKLKQGGFGLLVVERDNVFEAIKPVQQTPVHAKVSKVVAGLSNFQKIELD
jgi:hypothetical protein